MVNHQYFDNIRFKYVHTLGTTILGILISFETNVDEIPSKFNICLRIKINGIFNMGTKNKWG